MSGHLDFDPALREIQHRTAKSHPHANLAVHPEARIPVLVRLTDGESTPPGLEVIARFGDVITGRAEIARLIELRRHPCVASLKASRACGPCLTSSLRDPEISAQRQISAPNDLPTGRGVIVAVLDWGCDFAHANFRDDEGNSRLLAIWDQRPAPSNASPQPHGYGRVIEQEEINAALRASDPYDVLGYDPRDVDYDDSGTHGTHVLDIAAGSGRAPGAMPGVAPGADLLFVHLRGDDTPPQENLGDSARLLEAVDWVFRRAGDTPVVINMSLGRTGGPHDGTTLVERALDAALRERPGRAIVMSTGNYYSSSMHCHGRVSPGATVELDFYVPEIRPGPVELEVWYPGRDEFAVELVDPRGRQLGRVKLGEQSMISRRGHMAASVYHRRRDPNNGDNMVDIFLWPSAPSGVWTVRLHGREVYSGVFHAWIERVSPSQQARFTRESATRTSTTNTVCNGHETIAVGAYDSRIEYLPMARFSSSGPTRDGRMKPNVTAPGAGIVAARSVPLRGDGADLLVEKSGTSMAAPHVTGTVALIFEAARPRRLSIAETRAALLGSARPIPARVHEQTVRTGVGRVDATAAVASIRRTLKQKQLETKTLTGGISMSQGQTSRELEALEALAWLRGDGSSRVAEYMPEQFPTASGGTVTTARLRQIIALVTQCELHRWRAGAYVLEESHAWGQQILRYDYWSTLGITNPATYYNKASWWSQVPWSAAFVMYCVRQAEMLLGLGSRTLGHTTLAYNASHAAYVWQAYQDREARVYNRYWAYQPSEVAVEIGDIIVRSRDPRPDAQSWSIATSVPFDLERLLATHGDIVVESVSGIAQTPAAAQVIGGNRRVPNSRSTEGKTVTQSPYVLDGYGRVITTNNRVFAVLKPVSAPANTLA